MILTHSFLNRFSRLVAPALLLAALAGAATFGRVVPIGGNASDIALDEARSVLYIANYTSGRIDVMSTFDNTISRSITVAPYPGGVALSPNGKYLVVTHYASTGGGNLAKPGQDALTVLDLTNNSKRTFGLSSGPVGVAFEYDGLALILTQDEILLFDPVSGATTVVSSVANVKSLVLPAPQNTFPTQIIAGSVTATPDGRHIFGIGGQTPDTGSTSSFFTFSYNAENHQITGAALHVSAPSLAPRVLTVSRDASYFMTGWTLFGCGTGFLGDCTSLGPLIAQWPNASGDLSVGSLAIRSSKNLIYAQITQAPPKPVSGSQTVCLPNGTCVTVTTPGTQPAQSTLPPALLILESDNLTVRERIQLSENLAGRAVFSADENVLYSISESGVMVLPMAQLDKAPRVTPSAEDVVFRGNFCNSGPITQTLDINDLGGNSTPFSIVAAGGSSATGITISPSSGVTPAHVKITIDPTMISSMIGTKSIQFEIRSSAAVNMPPPPSRGRVETDYVTNTRSRFRVLINNREPENRGAFFNAPGELVDVLADPGRNRFYVLRVDRNQVLVYDATSYSLLNTLRTGNTPWSMAITLDRKYLLVGNDNSQIANRYDLDTLQQLAPIVFPPGHYPRSIAASAKAILAATRVAGPANTIDSVDLAGGVATELASLGPYKNDVHISTTLTPAPNGASIMAAMPDGRLLLYNASVDTFTISRQDFTDLKGAIAASSFGLYMVDHFLLNESLVALGPVVSGGDTSSGFTFVGQDGYSAAITSTGYGYVQRVKTATGLSPLPTMIVESPLTGGTDFPFHRTITPLADQSAFIALTTSGFTVIPWNYDAFTAPPVLDRVVNSADFTKPIAPGGLVSIFGSQLSPMTLSSTDVPLPTVLADSCLTVNGAVVPVSFVSSTQINAVLPPNVDGLADLVLRTPGGISDALRATISTVAPAVFRSGAAGPNTSIPTIFRAANNDLVTVSNPIHPNDSITIYLTGLGATSPEVPVGTAAPSDPQAAALVSPTVTLGGVPLFVGFAGLVPGRVGIYYIVAAVPFKGVPTGFEIPLVISAGGSSTTIPVRVVN